MNEQPEKVCASCGQRIPAAAKLAAAEEEPARVLCLRCRIVAARPEPVK